jgi:endo-1,4-beta-xylanase
MAPLYQSNDPAVVAVAAGQPSSTMLLPRLLLVFALAAAGPSGALAQLAAGKEKFLGNIVANSVPANFGTYWNQVTPENSAKWGSVESVRGTMNWSALDVAYQYATSNGYRFKAHTLVWGSQYPAWLTGLSPTEQRAEIEEWMTLLAARYPNIWAIDVVNEPVKTPLPFKNALGGDGATGWDWVITAFQLARQRFPNARLLINEYGTENDAVARGQMLVIINLLKDRGLIDGIGIQAHAFNLDFMTAAQMRTCLDAYAATGLDLYISELDIRGNGSTQTDAAQAAKYQELFPAMWEHSAVKGVTLWGYISGQTWLANTGIVNGDGTERGAMTWLKTYVPASLAPTPPPAPPPTAPPATPPSSGGGGGGAPSLWFVGAAALLVILRILVPSRPTAAAPAPTPVPPVAGPLTAPVAAGTSDLGNESDSRTLRARADLGVDSQVREDLGLAVRQWAERDLKSAMTWAAGLSGEERRIAGEGVIAQIGEDDSAGALEAMEIFGVGLDDGRAERVVQLWAEQEFSAALAWVEARPAAAQRDRLVARLTWVQAQRDAPAAIALAQELLPPGALRDEALLGIVRHWSARDPARAAVWVDGLADGSFRIRAAPILAYALRR